jgi:hypothetical protein
MFPRASRADRADFLRECGEESSTEGLVRFNPAGWALEADPPGIDWNPITRSRTGGIFPLHLVPIGCSVFEICTKHSIGINLIGIFDADLSIPSIIF